MQAYEVVTSAERLAAIAVEVEQRPVTALDLETTALSPRDGEIRICSLNTGSSRYVIDLFQTKTFGPLVDAFNKTKGIIVGQNLKFDQKWLLYKKAVEFERLFDTFRASSILYNGYQHVSHDLYDLFRRELKIKPEAQELGGSDWSGPLSKEQLDYAAEDIIHLPALRETLIPKLKAAGLIKIAQIEFQAILPEAAIELNGFWLDSERWREVAKYNEARFYASRALLLSELPNPKAQLLFPGFDLILPQKTKNGQFNKKLFNLDSPEQVLESLRMLGLTQKVYNKDEGRLEIVPLQDTKEMTLAMLAGKYPIVEKFIEYRGYSQRKKSFGEDYLEHISPQTGRVHTEFWPFTGAGRYASSNPNLQQIPREKVYRECFRAPPGRRLAIADYSNIEMRIVAEISRDKLLIQVFCNPKGDAHKTTASLLASVPEDQVSKAQRQQAKPVNFGFIYGMQAPRLVLYARANYGVTLTEGQAIKFRKKFFEAYHGVGTWHEFVIHEAQRLKLAQTIWGRRRFLDPETAHNEFFNCLDAETEALTQRGWVKGFDLKKEDVLLTKNAESDALVWQPMTDLKQWPNYEGPLVEFKSRSFSAVSTPNHRWLVTNKATGKNECRTTAELSPHGDHRIHRVGDYEGPTVSSYADDFVELCGWFLTDGTALLLDRKRGPDKPVVRLVQSARANPDKVAQIDALLDRLVLRHGRYFYEKHGHIVTWQLGPEVSARLMELFPERELTGGFLASLTRTQADTLLDTMMKGDGTIDPVSGKESFVSRSETAAGLFQVLLTLCGRASTLHKRDMSKYEPKSEKLSNVPKMGVHWCVNVLRRDKVQVLEEHRREFHSKQGVWCPVVPNTYFVARRAGHVYITGNTPVQGSGADGLKNSLRIVYRRFKKLSGGEVLLERGARVGMVHMVHDEIVGEHADEGPEFDDVVCKELEGGMIEGMAPMMRLVPTVCEAAAGACWADKP